MELLKSTASPPGGNGRCNSSNALPHYLRAVHSGTAAMHCLLVWGSGEWKSCNPQPHCLASGTKFYTSRVTSPTPGILKKLPVLQAGVDKVP